MKASNASPATQGVSVDLVIAVHNRARPIGRAVASAALAGLEMNKPGGVRITVVCHNVGIDGIAPGISDDLRSHVRYLQLDDDIASPAGPLNLGLDKANAPYVAVMGSDDMLEQGALKQWLAIAVSCGSDVVIAPQRHADGRKVRTPVLRVGRTRKLDPIKDRLAYRTAPLGLIRTAEIDRLGLRFTAGLPTGEDQEFSARLWFGGGRIDYASGAGRYVVGADAGDRVTYTRRPVPDELEFVARLVSSDWFAGRTSQERQAIAVKLIRVHLFGLILSRHDSGGWTRQDQIELASVLTSVLTVADDAVGPLSKADMRLVDAILSIRVSQSQLLELARARRRFGSVDTLLPNHLGAALNPESPLRFMPAAALLR